MSIDKNKYVIQKIFFGLVILLEIIFQFKGARIEYDVINFSQIKNFYSNDMFFHNEYKQSTLLHYLIPFDLNNDYIGFSIHLFLAIIAFYYSFKLVREVFNIDLFNSIFLIILLGFISHFILPEVKSDISPKGYSNGSIYGFFLTFPIIYFTLKKSYKSIPLIFFGILLSFKYLALVSSFCIFFNLINLKVNNKKVYLEILFFILAFVILYIRTLSIESAEENNIIEVINNYLNTQNSESFIIYNSNLSLLFFLCHLFIFYYLINKISLEKFYKNFLKILFYFSILLVIYNISYSLFFFKLIPSYKLLILDVVSFLRLLQFFYLIIIFKYLIEKKISNISIILIFGSILYWRWSSDYIFFNKKIVLIIFGFSFLSLFFQDLLKKIKIMNNRNSLIISSLILILPFLNSNIMNSIQNYNSFTLKNTNKIYFPIKNENFLYFLMQLKKVEDFELAHIKKDKKVYTLNNDINFFTKKSQFARVHATDCRLFNSRKIKECNRRAEYIDKVIKNVSPNLMVYNDLVIIFSEFELNNNNFIHKDLFKFNNKEIYIYSNNTRAYEKIKLIYNNM